LTTAAQHFATGGVPARKDDGAKPRMDLIAWDAVRVVAEVMTFGATKYAARNYYGLEQSRIFAAMQRHVTAWWLGEDDDPETGLPHLAHAMSCTMMLLEMQLQELGNDDRPTKESA
jgi:hypothetical protein